MSERPIRAVVVGYGHAGARIHVPLIRLAPQVELMGVCSSDEAKRERISSELGCKTYDDFGRVLDDVEVELVVLATPNAVHAPQALLAMNAGKHVLIDKPMCLTSGEAGALVECSRRTGMALSVFHNRRWDGDYLTLRRLVDSGRLGDLRWLEMAWQRSAMPRSWKQDAASGGGRMIDLGSHLIDQALQLFAAPVSTVFCRMHRDYLGLSIESHAMLSMVFADGRTAVIDTTGLCYAPKPRILALGDRATFVKYGIDPQEVALAASNIDGAVEGKADWGVLAGPAGEERVETVRGRWREFYERLGSALQQWPGGELPVTAAQAARVIAVMEGAADSAKTGRAVVLNV